MYLFLINIHLKNYFFLFFSPVRKRKHRSSKHQHHQSGNVKRQKQEQSQYWTAEKKRTVGVVEPRVVVRIPKKHLSEDSTVLVFLNFLFHFDVKAVFSNVKDWQKYQTTYFTLYLLCLFSTFLCFENTIIIFFILYLESLNLPKTKINT